MTFRRIELLHARERGVQGLGPRQPTKHVPRVTAERYERRVAGAGKGGCAGTTDDRDGDRAGDTGSGHAAAGRSDRVVPGIGPGREPVRVLGELPPSAR